jgi:hypothetical protein
LPERLAHGCRIRQRLTVGAKEKARRSEPEPETSSKPMPCAGLPEKRDEGAIPGREMIV